MNKQQKNNRTLRLGVDVMSSSNRPEDIVKELIFFAKNEKNLDFTFFAKNDLKSKFKLLEKELNHPLNIVFVEHVIEMTDDPLLSIRRKKQSSIFEGLRYLKNDEIDAFISTGNTGALTAGSMMILKTFKNISRPAFLVLIPTKKNLTAVLDVGASISFTSEHLVQFAKLGVAFQKVKKIKRPKVGILNIGEEQKKGTYHHQKAYQKLLKIQDSFQFIGNIEGKEVFEGRADVIITDGFTGNIFLKTAEGLTSFILDKIHQNISSNQKSEIFNILKDLKTKLYYGEYPGALLIGVEKPVIKCHGYSSIKSIVNATKSVIELVKIDIISSIKEYLE